MNLFEISPAVKKAVRQAELSVDRVLREALGIKNEGFASFPEGTVFVAWYKDKAHSAQVKDGALCIEGKSFTSLSSAAASITGRPTTNGWSFWLVRYPGKVEFVPIQKPPKAA